MRAPNCGITPEGWPCIGLTALSALVFACMGWWLLAVIFLALCWFSMHFFRDPERVVPQGEGLAVSPADGKVIRIEERPDPFTDEPKLCISIFMNVFSVHVNRAPVAGTVEGIRYFPGAFVNAAFDKASTHNERCAYSMVGRQPELEQYAINAITGGTDAQGEVTVRLREGEVSAVGRGTHPDIFVASARAYVNALNHLFKKEQEGPRLHCQHD